MSMITPAVDLGNIEDGKWHNVKVTWDVASHTLSYTFDGRSAGTLAVHLDNSSSAARSTYTSVLPQPPAVPATCIEYASLRSMPCSRTT